MKPSRSILLLALVVAGCAAFTAAAVAQTDTPTYTNAEVVSVDPQARTLVIKTPGGHEQTVELDDSVGGLADIAAGDRVIVSLRKEPGRSRVSAITKSTAPAMAKPAAPPKKEAASATRKIGKEAEPVTDPMVAAAFGDRVATLAGEAARVDSLWSGFRSSCDVKLSRPYDGAREWFSIWDDQVRADLSSGFCRDLFNQIVGKGEAVKQAMSAAEDAARKGMSPGAIREIRLRYAMDWDGWERPAPERLEL